MQPDGTVEIGIYTTEIEARAAAAALEAAGIPAHVDADDCGGMRPELAFSNGVRLYVPAEREEEARALLAAAAAEGQRPAWTCPRCGERNEGSFDVCWQCGTDRPAD